MSHQGAVPAPLPPPLQDKFNLWAKLFSVHDVNVTHSGQTVLLYSWNFSSNSVHSHWSVRDHMTSNNETVSHQKSLNRQHCKVYYVRISSTVHLHNQSVGIIFVNISSTVASTLLRLHINKDNMFLNKHTKICEVS